MDEPEERQPQEPEPISEPVSEPEPMSEPVSEPESIPETPTPQVLEEPVPASPPQKKNRTWLIVLIVVLVLILCICILIVVGVITFLAPVTGEIFSNIIENPPLP